MFTLNTWIFVTRFASKNVQNFFFRALKICFDFLNAFLFFSWIFRSKSIRFIHENLPICDENNPLMFDRSLCVALVSPDFLFSGEHSSEFKTNRSQPYFIHLLLIRTSSTQRILSVLFILQFFLALPLCFVKFVCFSSNSVKSSVFDVNYFVFFCYLRGEFFQFHSVFTELWFIENRSTLSVHENHFFTMNAKNSIDL